MSERVRLIGATLLRLYPAEWRDRYEPEVQQVLEEAGLSRRGAVDLVRGAADARLHSPSRVPPAAALLAGGIWTLMGTWIVTQPAPPDWPGYTFDVLVPAIAAVMTGLVAVVGAWAVGSDAAGRRVGGAAIALAVGGHAAWMIALIAALAGAASGPLTALGQGLGVSGCAIVGIVMLRAGQVRLGTVLALAPTVMLFGWPSAWLAFGLGWTLVGMLLLQQLVEDRSSRSPL